MVAHRSREILVIHPGALGDVLQAVPALVALRALPQAHRLAFAGQARLGRLLVGSGLVEDALPFDGLGLESLFASAAVPPEVHSRLARFGRVVSWFGSRAEPFPERLRAIVPQAVLAPPVPEGDSSLTVWEHLLETLRPWGVEAPARLAPLSLPEAWRSEARLLLSRLGADTRRPLLVVHPGAGGAWKRWSAEGFAAVMRRAIVEIGSQGLIHQGPADRNAVDRLARLLDLPVLLLAEPPLHVLAGILQEAGAYLGADSGVSHLAATVGAPAVILFPAATRERWAPWSPTAFPLTMPADRHGIESVARAVIERLLAAGDSRGSAEERKERVFNDVVRQEGADDASHPGIPAPGV